MDPSACDLLPHAAGWAWPASGWRPWGGAFGRGTRATGRRPPGC